jgi:hypothetical protein
MTRDSFRNAPNAMRLLACTGLALFTFGCAHVPTQTGAMQHIDMKVSADVLHVQVVEHGRRFSGMVETSADGILARTQDPKIRYDVLLWKAYAIPLIQEAALRTDPVLAVGDLWAFSIQQHDFFASGAGRDAFGPHHGVALATAERMEREALAFVNASAPSDSGVKTHTVERMHAWAASHPFEGLRFTRESAAAEFDELLGPSSDRLAATVGDIDRTLASINDRLGYVNESTLKQVRWNTELMVADAFEGPTIRPTLLATNSALERIGALAENMPGLLDHTTAAALITLREERIAALQAMSAERVAVMHGVIEERLAVIAAIRDERLAILAEADKIAARSVERSERAAVRLMWFGAAMVAGLGTVAWILMLSTRRLWRVPGRTAAA